LSSGYIEQTTSGKSFYPPGSILKRPANWQHSLEIDAPAWSLILAGPRKRKWGFWPKSGEFIPYQHYDAKAHLCPDD
jgi:hypothetical protein